jgi:ankyrin repeat protein
MKKLLQCVIVLALVGASAAYAAPGLAQQPHATETRALGMAVSVGNTEQVKLLLSQGANPLAGMPSALERSLYITASNATYKRGSRLPPHAGTMLPLLVRHIVKVQKVPLASIRWKPLEQALQDAAESDDDAAIEGEADGTARVRLLLAAGFSARNLSEAAAAAALALPDRDLTSELLDHGMLQDGPWLKTSPANARILLTAVAWRRADLVPRLLELGYDPNLRTGNNPSPVEYAARVGAANELAALLAGGGHLEGAAPQ